MNAGIDPKKAVRFAVRERLDASSASDRQAWSSAISASLTEHIRTHDLKTIFFFQPVGTEVDIAAAIDAAHADGRTVCLPRIDWEAGTMDALAVAPGAPMVVHRHGIPEPVEGDSIAPQALDAIITPGLAFEASGTRLGRGGGYYDRYVGACLVDNLSKEGPSPRRIGVCFEIQLWDGLPAEDHDVAMDLLITERRILVIDPDRVS